MTLTPQIVLSGDNPRTRRTDPETSHDAADRNNIHGAQKEVLWYLALHNLADHELVAMYEFDARMEGNTHPFTPQRLRTARAELVASGAVKFAGDYHTTPTGGRTRVWSLT